MSPVNVGTVVAGSGAMAVDADTSVVVVGSSTAVVHAARTTAVATVRISLFCTLTGYSRAIHARIGSSCE